MRILSTIALINLAILGSKAMKDIPSKELLKDINIGWSLGNTLDAKCLDDYDYYPDQVSSETCWGNPKTTPEVFQKLASVGFNIFRIPTTWTGHFGEGPDYKISDEWMKRVHEVVDYALSVGGYAILNIHHETWNYAFSDNLAKAEEILVAIWNQIAAEFGEYDEHLIFEGLNEPRKVDTDVEWNGGDQEGWDFVNEMNALFVKTIRATGGNNALRHLMIPTYAASVNDGAVENYKYPSGDDKLIVSVHSYSPYNFALNTGEGAVTTFTATSEVDWAMNNIKKNFISKDIPVIIGEFGAMNRDNEDERAKWAEYYVKSAHAMGVPTVLWDNGIFEGEGELFGIIDRTNIKITYPKLVKGLMAGLGKTIEIEEEPEAEVEIPATEPQPIETVPTPEPEPIEPAPIPAPEPQPIETVPAPEPQPIEPIEPEPVEPIPATEQQPAEPIEVPTPEQPAQPIEPIEPEQPSEPAQPVQPAEPASSSNGCESNDWDCKTKMANKCYAATSNCWIEGRSVEECNKMIAECDKIWTL